MKPNAAVVILLGAAAALAVPPPVAAADSAAGLKLTLADALQRALASNDSIVIEREGVITAAAAVSGARGAYDPLLAVDAGWRRSSEPVNSAFSGAPAGSFAPVDESFAANFSLSQRLTSGTAVALRAGVSRISTDSAFAFLAPAYGSTIGLELRQPLLRGRAVDGARRTLRVAGADLDRGEALLRGELLSTVAAVELAYWALVAAREEVGVRDEAVQLAEEQLEETRIRIESGIAPDTEISQPHAELERRRGESLASREALARAENALKLLILADDDGLAWSLPIVPSDDPEIERATVDRVAAIERALAARPEIAAAAAFEERSRVERELARDDVRPTLDAVVSYDRFGLAGSLNPAAEPIPGLPATVPPTLEGSWGRTFGVLEDGDFDDTRVGLAFTLPLRNRGAHGALSAAESAERRAQAETSRARKEIRAQVLDAAAALETAYQRVEAARAGREAARVQLEAERDRFTAGLSTNFLVLTRQNDLSRARLVEIEARTDYRKATTEVARATGDLLDERGIEVVTADPGGRS